MDPWRFLIAPFARLWSWVTPLLEQAAGIVRVSGWKTSGAILGCVGVLLVVGLVTARRKSYWDG